MQLRFADRVLLLFLYSPDRLSGINLLILIAGKHMSRKRLPHTAKLPRRRTLYLFEDTGEIICIVHSAFMADPVD